MLMSPLKRDETPANFTPDVMQSAIRSPIALLTDTNVNICFQHLLVNFTTSFFLANVVKVADGGYVPLLLAILVYGVMLIWHRGSTAVATHLGNLIVPEADFMRDVKAQNIPRVPGTGVFLTRTLHDTPPVMIWHVKHNRALHQNVFVLHAVTESIPWIPDSERLIVTEVLPNYWRAAARFGFMEKPDIPELLKQACVQDPVLNLGDIVYYVGQGTVVHRDDGQGLVRWQEVLYAAMERNSVHVSDYFRLPTDRVVLIGRQIAI